MSETADNSLPIKPSARPGPHASQLISLAVALLRKRFPTTLDQHGQLLFDLLDRVVDNAERHGNAAVTADATRLEEFAFERWTNSKAEQEAAAARRRIKPRESQPDGRTRPILEIDIVRLVRYWQRGCVNKTEGQKRRKKTARHEQKFRALNPEDVRAESVTTTSATFTITETVPCPSWSGRESADVIFTIAALHAEQPLDQEETATTQSSPKSETVPVLTISATVEGMSNVSDAHDPVVLLPLAARAVDRALDDTSRALATTFRSYQKRKYQWHDSICEVTVVRRRTFLRTTLRAAATAFVVLLVGCAVAYERRLATIRHELYSISNGGMGAVTYCENGKLWNHVYWENPLPAFTFARVRLLRNGKPVARVDGVKEYDDSEGLVHGARYNYSLDVVDWFGRTIKQESNRISAGAICPGEKFNGTSGIKVFPAAGTWDTQFTLTAEPSTVDGRDPKLFSWGWKGTQLDYATNKMYEPFDAATPTRSVVHRFSPCDECSSDSGPDGILVWRCLAEVNVTFGDDTVVRYHTTVPIRDIPPSECDHGRIVPRRAN